MTDKQDRLRGKTIQEIARILYGEKGAMSALARGLGVTPGYVNNVSSGLKPVTSSLNARLVLLCRREKDAYRERADDIERLEALLGSNKVGDE